MRSFVYGTLLDGAALSARGGDPTLSARRSPATLTGWRRVALRCVAGTSRVTGAVIDVPSRALARLAAYEGPTYRIVRVVAATTNGKTAARTWIAPAATRRPWQAKGVRTPCCSHRQPDPACARTRSIRPRC
jgi:gamma-glutamylcyclotransferase (GGCT)/AIG2-like uncharacterized protein YtfP